MSGKLHDNLLQDYTRFLVRTLTKKGEDLIEEAIRKKGFQNRTYNLHDSYGSAVYLDGKIIVESIRVLTPEAKEAKKYGNTYILGSDKIVDFLMSAEAKKTGISLIVAAAMPYAETLEKNDYKVISSAYSSMESIARAHHGKVTRYGK